MYHCNPDNIKICLILYAMYALVINLYQSLKIMS